MRGIGKKNRKRKEKAIRVFQQQIYIYNGSYMKADYLNIRVGVGVTVVDENKLM